MIVNRSGGVAKTEPLTHVVCDCSGCNAEFDLDTVALTVTMRVPSNGKRGAGHVVAHRVAAEAVEYNGLVEWDCPTCGYAESYDPTGDLNPNRSEDD